MLELKNLTKIYKTKSNDVVALDKVNLSFGETGMVFVTGKSGSGKTTLLNVVGGLDSFDEGDLVVKGKSFADFKQQDFDDYRNTFIGFVFQAYNLLDEMSVEKNISLAMELQGAKKRDVDKINRILEQVDLSGLNDRLPSELSGGQKQRVAIARAIVKDPKIILTDEPTGALDTNSGVQVMSLLKELSRDRLVIIVSHNTELAQAYADRIIEMKDGAIESDYTLTRTDNSKELRVKEYDKRVIVKSGAKLSDKDLKLLQNAVEQSKDIQIVDGNRFYEETATKPTAAKQYSPADSKFIKGRLGVKNTLKLGLSNLKIKPVRLAITIVLCAIAFSVFGLFDAMTIYDESRLTANTLRNSNVPGIVLSASMRESNGDEYEMNVNQSLIDDLNAETGLNFKGVYSISPVKPDETKSIANISKYYATSKLTGVVEVKDEDELTGLGFSVKAGRLPVAYNEIAIPEYYAMCIINYGYTYGDFVINADNCRDYKPEDLIKDTPLVLTLNRTAYNVVGIVDVGEMDDKYDGILADYSNAVGTLKVDFENYVNNSFLLYGFVKDGFVANKYAEEKTLLQYKNPSYAYEFGLTETELQYYFNYDELTKLGNLVKFIDGEKTSLSGNEVLVNVNLCEQIYADKIAECTLLATNSNFTEDLDLMDASLSVLQTVKTTVEEKFKAVDDLLSIMTKPVYQTALSYFETASNVVKRDTTRYENDSSGELAKVPLQNSRYKVVGFYSGLSQSVNVHALVLTESGLSNLGISLKQGAYNSVIAPSVKSTAQINKVVGLVKRTEGIKFTCLNNVISIITLNHDALQDVSTLFLAASAVFAVFAIAMMANYISTSINNRHTQIGILRALGTRGSDVLLMFFAESLIIA